MFIGGHQLRVGDTTMIETGSRQSFTIKLYSPLQTGFKTAIWTADKLPPQREFILRSSIPNKIVRNLWISMHALEQHLDETIPLAFGRDTASFRTPEFVFIEKGNLYYYI